MEGNNSAVGNMARDQISTMLSISTPSTPPPLISNTTASSSVGVAGTIGSSNLAYVSTTSTALTTTNIASSANNRNTTATSVTNVNSSNTTLNRDQVYSWIQELSAPETREHALIELSRKREVLPDLAPLLWHSFGTIAALLQEIVMIYPVINPPTLNVRLSPPLGISSNEMF